MKIYKLTPRDLSDPAWSYSTHKGIAIVRAADERAARAEARKAFIDMAPVPPNDDTRHEPWPLESKVSVEEYSDPQYPPDGEPGVLDPEVV
jgi:hypothetical protein